MFFFEDLSPIAVPMLKTFFVATGGTSSAPVLIALRGEMDGHQRRTNPGQVSAVSAQLGKLMSSAQFLHMNIATR